MSGPSPSSTSHPVRVSQIVLTGFMGAGKSTVGALLAARLGWNFLDSDRVIEAREAMPIAQIFAQRGEAAFRQIEALAIRECMAGERLVLALGGGALETAETRSLLEKQSDTLVVFLEAPLPTLVSRCASHDGGPVRPVLADTARLEERWRSRQGWYRTAHLTIATRELTPDAVVERVLQHVPGTVTGAGARP